jgi:hypothetical protein
MHPQKRVMLLINLLGGSAVLGSYAQGIWTHPDSGAALWGGVPLAIRPLYGISMVLAAAGYFAFSSFLLFRVDPDQARLGPRYGYGWLNLSYLLILVPSALWMPLTYAMTEQPSGGLWLAIRLVLVVVGLGSLGLLAALLKLRPRDAGWGYRLAVGGAVAFCIQTAVLDALVWPAFFPV